MMRLARLRAAGPLLVVLGAFACDGPNTTLPVPGSAARSTAPQATLGAEISALISSGFPTGEATAIAARWDQVLRSIEKEPTATLKGKLVPGSGGRAELVKTVKYIESKTLNSTPPSDETQAHFVARLVLDMALYVYNGPTTPVPIVAPGSDVVLKVIQPTSTDTVVTPAKAAAVIFPAGAVSEPTVVVIMPVAAYYPANCSGPLDTHLCQYPKFYHFNVFPDVRLNAPANVQVCHVDAGTLRLPLADHARFKVAHEKPADAANYTSGVIFDNVELLTPVAMNVTTCAANGGTTYLPPPATLGSMTPLGQLTHLASFAVHRLSVAALTLITPREAYAIDVGVGGEALFFSTFGVVDPLSQADLAQSTAAATAFHSTSDSVAVGAPAPIAAWNITNIGSGTSGAFTSQVIVANDAALTSVISTTAVGGAASLVPFSTYAYPAVNVAMPSTPGTYYVGTRIVPAGSDALASNDWASVRVVVKAPAVLVPQTVGAAPWTAGGPGVTSATVAPNDVLLSYNHTPSGYDYQTWTYTSTAVATGNFTFNWTYTGFHSSYDVTQHLEAFANGPTGATVVQLVNVYIWGNAGHFSHSGTTTLPLTAGYTWGLRPAGRHSDFSQILLGTVHLTEAIPVVVQ